MKPKFDDVHGVEFEKGSMKLFYERNTREVSVTNLNVIVDQGVYTAKTDNIIKVLCPHMKESVLR